MTSEPPIMIGRGLTATTGVIAAMLALAVLWTMVPTQAGRTAVVSVLSTLATTEPATIPVSLQSPLDTPDATTLAASTVVPNTVVPNTDVPNSEVANTVTPPTTAAEAPMVTYNVQPTKTVAEGAIAIAVSGSNLVITTAFAVSADHSIELLLTDGTSEVAEVLFVDSHSGLAVLATHSLRSQMDFKFAEIAPGDELMLAGNSEHRVKVAADGAFDQAFMDAEWAREGTPVMNQDGDLVGLCSGSSREPFVVLEGLEALQRALANWAGLIAGDIVIAINGIQIADSRSFIESLAGLLPGDKVKLIVRHAAGEDTAMMVELGAAARNGD